MPAAADTDLAAEARRLWAERHPESGRRVYTQRAIGTRLGMSAGWVNEVVNAGPSAGGVPAPGAGPARTPGAVPGRIPKAELDALRAAVGGEPEDDAAEAWRALEEKTARNLKRWREAATFRLTAPGKHLLLAAVSDQHIGGAHTDHRQMRLDAELIRDTPGVLAILGGDGIDNAIKHRASVVMHMTTPDEQYQYFEHYLRILGDKAVLGVGGNHEAWGVAFSGVDVLGRILRANRLFYNPNQVFIEITVGSQVYTVAIRHQYRMNSSQNQTHAPKQWMRLGDREFDIGIVGHHHEPAIESTMYRGRERWVCRPGSYQITSGYSDQYGYNPAVPTTPTFLLRGDCRDVVGFPTLRAALGSGRALRELGAA